MLGAPSAAPKMPSFLSGRKIDDCDGRCYHRPRSNRPPHQHERESAPSCGCPCRVVGVGGQHWQGLAHAGGHQATDRRVVPVGDRAQRRGIRERDASRDGRSPHVSSSGHRAETSIGRALAGEMVRERCWGESVEREGSANPRRWGCSRPASSSAGQSPSRLLSTLYTPRLRGATPAGHGPRGERAGAGPSAQRQGFACWREDRSVRPSRRPHPRSPRRSARARLAAAARLARGHRHRRRRERHRQLRPQRRRRHDGDCSCSRRHHEQAVVHAPSSPAALLSVSLPLAPFRRAGFADHQLAIRDLRLDPVELCLAFRTHSRLIDRPLTRRHAARRSTPPAITVARSAAQRRRRRTFSASASGLT